MANYDDDAIVTRDKLNSLSPSMCMAKWLQVSLHLPHGRTHSCYHPPTHPIPLEELKKDSENKRVSKLELARRQKNALEDFSQNYILKNINTLESYFQSPMKEKYLYLAWVPEEINTKSQKDILALIVCNKEEEEEEKKLVLKCIITNPSWSGENIESIELKKCLYALESKEYKLDITEFYKEPSNIRFKLDWSF